MSKRLFTSLAISVMLPLAFIALVWAVASSVQSQSKPPTVMDAKVKPNVPLGVWGDLPAFPSVDLGFSGSEPTFGPLMLRRAGAVGYPPNGKVYILGGRHRPDGADIGSRWIWEYNPSNNTLVQKSALLDANDYGSRFVANMAVAVLTDTNGPRIYAIGGSSVDVVASNAVRVYNPVNDTISTLPDTWPASPARIPGGWAVYNNKLYIFGGHAGKPTSQLFSDTWVFDPMMPQGQRWTQLVSGNLGTARAYIAGAQLDGYIYAIGGDIVISNTVTPLTNVERLDATQGSPTWQPVASLPWARGDMSAWAYDTGTGYEISGRIVIAGGSYPNPEASALIYSPGSNSWSAFPDMLRARRNYGAAQLNGILYAWGGYDVQGNVYNGSNSSMAYNGSGPPPPPAITPSATPSPMPTVCSATANYTYTVSTGASIDPGTTLLPGTTCSTCFTNLTLPFPVQLYGRTFSTAVVGSTGTMQFGSSASYWINRALPYDPYRYTLLPFWDDLTMSGSGRGIYTSVAGGAPNRIFNVEWRTSTASFEVRLFENSTSFEYVYGTGSGGTGTIGVQKDLSYYTQSGYNVPQPASGSKYSWTTAACGTSTPTVTGTPPTATRTATPTNTLPPTNTPTPLPTVCSNYNIGTGSATIVPGTTDIGNHCDDCVTTITLPFPILLYGQLYTIVTLSSNGNAQFTGSDPTFTNVCLPASGYNYAIFPYWDDLRTDGTGNGIFTSVSGTAPNRIFNIEWRTVSFSGGNPELFELRLYENSPNARFDVIYGINDGNGSATGGVQKDSSLYVQYFCNGAGGSTTNGTLVTYTLPACGSVTATVAPPTYTRTSTPVAPTATRTNTAIPPTATIVPPTNTALLPTNTAVPPTSTNVPPTSSAVIPTNTNVPPTGTAAPPTSTSVPSTSTAVPSTNTVVVPTPTTCSIQFTDVPPGSTFYTYIECLACNGIINGYPDGTFGPNNNVTRGQIAKIVANAAGLNGAPGAQLFEDVPSGHIFYDFVQRLANLGVINGYPCGGAGEPCGVGNRPWYRPDSNATRGQISKIVANAAGLNGAPGAQIFEDVPPSHVFYDYIQRLAAPGYMNGYPCGGPGEPCGVGNRPYFRPQRNASRGQTSKIVANAFMQDCDLQTR